MGHKLFWHVSKVYTVWQCMACFPFCASFAVSRLVLNSMKCVLMISKFCAYMLPCLSPSDTSRLCCSAQSDLEKFWRLMNTGWTRLQKCGVLLSKLTACLISPLVDFWMDTSWARFLLLASAFNIEIPRSSQAVATWVYGTPMLLWQHLEALAVGQGFLPWELFHPKRFRRSHPGIPCLDLCLCLPFPAFRSYP